MFDFGFWEIAVIGIITLIVVGPEKMPGLARKAGLYAGKFKKFITKIKTDINDELKADDLKEYLSLKEEESVLSQTLDEVKSGINEIKQANKMSADTASHPEKTLKEGNKDNKNEDSSHEDFTKSEPQNKK
tara:strand:- start:919 stop:1311 length:393 start_codon:yes stop_codon:yes gene_type:complete